MTESKENWDKIADCLKTSIANLELDSKSSLYQDAIALTEYLTKTSFQIAVFAPFNHGKSTLLNALLGSKSLPIDLIPSTGAAITIKYGQNLSTKIILEDGTEKTASDTKILQEYAILDRDRSMRSDLKAVEVTCNYPLLKNNVELLDLPGTNDREAQDKLVKDKLLTADLIIHVLDARKLMTLLEREKLRDWLQARGITTVIFVVNFLNLLEPEDQKKVYNRLKFVAESFRSQLPPGISNLYRVDALPALRARIKGDYNTVMETGLTNLETALQTIVKSQQQRSETKINRLQTLSQQLIKISLEKQTQIQAKIDSRQQKEQQQIAIKQKAANLIKQGMQRSISEFESWLYLPNLLKTEQANLAIALQEKNFSSWKKQFNQTVTKYQKNITEWLAKSQEFFPQERQLKLIINFPEPPIIDREQSQTKSTTNYTDENNSVTAEIDKIFDRAMKTILTGDGKEIFREFINSKQKPTEPKQSLSQLYAEAAEAYLSFFSQRAFVDLHKYRDRGEQLLAYEPPANNQNVIPEEQVLRLLRQSTNNLEQELESVSSCSRSN